MNVQGNPIFLQPGQALSHVANLQPSNVGANISSNFQIWTPSSSGAITVSGLAQTPCSSNFVTLSSGQTVLMTGFTTTTVITNPSSIPNMSVSSPVQKVQMQLPTGLATGSQIVLTGTGTGQLTNPTVIQGPNGSISMALSNNLLTYSTINSFGASSNPTFGPNVVGCTSSAADHSIHLAQYSTSLSSSPSSSLSLSNPNFNSNVNFQNFPNSINQVLLDSSNLHGDKVNDVSFGQQIPNQPINNLVSIQPPQTQPIITPSSLSSSLIQTPTSTTSMVTSTVVNSIPITNLSTDLTISAQSIGQTFDMNLGSESGSLLSLNGGSQTGGDVLTAKDHSTDSNAQFTNQSMDNPTSFLSTSNSTELSTSFVNSQSKNNSKPVHSMSNFIFTPSSLTSILNELDPHLQIDMDAEEALYNLANEFVISCAEKAQKLAAHRGCSTVDSKDVLFSMERDWNIVVPGYVFEVRPQKRAMVSDIHKQRMALIKKQIKKM